MPSSRGSTDPQLVLLDLFDELDDVHVAFETLAVPASAFTGQRDADASAEGHARAFRAALRAQT
jgi:hypothetical protein